MKKLNKHKGKIFIIIFILFTIYTIYDTYNFETKSEIKTQKSENIEKKEETKKQVENKILIDIKGEIINPGVYELTPNNTVMDAINKAGGLTKTSDTSNINLSKKLEDEMVIIVYSKKEISQMKKENKIECPPCNNACIKPEDEKAKLEKENETETKGKININQATAEELQTLTGIGQSKALAIIDYRNKNGNFKTIEDIKNVSGIGDSAYEKIKNNITV